MCTAIALQTATVCIALQTATVCIALQFICSDVSVSSQHCKCERRIETLSPTPFTTNNWTLAMLGNSPIISVSGSHYHIKKERRQNSAPDHKHSNLSSREIVCVTSQLPSTPTTIYLTQHCDYKFLLNALFIPHFAVQWPGHGLDNGGFGVRLPIR